MLDFFDEQMNKECEDYLESGELFECMDSDDIENWMEDDD